MAHAVLASILLKRKADYDRAGVEARKAIALDPNNSESVATLAEVLIYTGRSEAAVELLQQAMRLNPVVPGWFRILMAQALFSQRRYREAINQIANLCEDAGTTLIVLTCYFYLSSAYGHLGEISTGQAIIRPWITFGGGSRMKIDSIETQIQIRLPFKNKVDHDHLLSGIRKSWPKN